MTRRRDTHPVLIHCEHCHRDGRTHIAEVVSLTVAELGDIYTWSQWRVLCPHCHHIQQTDCTVETADLLVDAGYPHHVIAPPYREHPEHGPWTLNDIKAVRAIHTADDNTIWQELDRHLGSTDSGYIDWGDDT